MHYVLIAALAVLVPVMLRLARRAHRAETIRLLNQERRLNARDRDLKVFIDAQLDWKFANVPAIIRKAQAIKGKAL